MNMLCVGLVTAGALIGAMRIGGVKHRVYVSIAHCFVGFLYGAGWGIPSPVFLRTAWSLTVIEVGMFFYERVYLRRILHVEPENPAALDPLHGTRRRLWGIIGEPGPHERWAAGQPVEAPRVMKPDRPPPPPPPKHSGYFRD